MAYISDFCELREACDEVSELVQYLHTQQTTDTTTSLSKLPGCMSGLVSNIILGRFSSSLQCCTSLLSLFDEKPGLKDISLCPAELRLNLSC